MKSLSLYIDRWYIVAALCNDNVQRRIELPNREDRIWLYFYEDCQNDRIIYGKNYQQHYLNKELHYYGDIFSLIVKEEEKFVRFGQSVDIKEIFKVSEIFDHLRKSFGNNEKIITNISFSGDVTLASQKIFLDILAANDFNVKESVARIAHLTLEYSLKKGLLQDAKHILVMNACNENLRYAVYEKNGNMFLRHGEESILKGYGTDLRGRALLEQIVQQINQSSNFLKNEEEIEEEILRLSQNLEAWLLQLDNVRLNKPTVYKNITFSRQPHNPQSAIIVKTTIEERTKITVNSVVQSVEDHIKRENIYLNDITDIVFIGNSFQNRMFREALLQRFPFSEDRIICYVDKDLPEIVSVYNFMDLSQFSAARSDMEKLSAIELEQIKIAEEERKAREIAAQKQNEIDQANAEIRKAQKNYEDAMQMADSYENKSDYNNMIDVLETALSYKPGDPEALRKLNTARRQLSEIKVKNEQYNKTIRQAQDYFKEKRWPEALSKSEAALNLRPDSTEAQRIYKESRRNIELNEKLKEFLLRADTFIGQKLYPEALEELKKAKLVNTENLEITKRIQRIENIQEEQKTLIDSLKQKLHEAEQQKAYENAIKLCDELLDKDVINQRNWSEHKAYLQTELSSQKQKKERFENLKHLINEASFNEDWKNLSKFCTEALNIQEDETTRKFYNKAEQKLKILSAQKAFEQAVANIKALIVDKQWEEASNVTKQLQKNYPEHNSIAKQLFKQIFEAEESWISKTEKPKSTSNSRPISEPTSRPKIGFRVEKEDFFEEEKNTQSQKTASRITRQSPPIQPKPAPSPKNNNDFFDEGGDLTQEKNSRTSINAAKITNDDFNF